MTPTDTTYFDEFCKAGKFRIAKKGECLYNLDFASDYVYCLEDGLCALLSITKSGEEKIYHYFAAGSIINFTPAYLTLPPDANTSAFYMYAKTDCRLYEIPYSNFYQLLSDNPTLNRYIMSLFANYFSDVLNHFHFMQESSTPSRLCKTLLDFSRPSHGRNIVDKHFNYVELAKYLGVHTVTVSRIMRSLKQEGAIEKDGHSIIIRDRSLLEDYIHEKKMLTY
ncbi:Crp/Fnr family transcriptional regulator [Niameybacter massiliensis]|uniref:Crp/Fnr family transcriptional regulator n=1 Tax=Holtiella tumoricola TaxID=3018743 RepID=A0AA42DSR0_9FIRM|nr:MULTISPECIES: Crp/Fnr family transcriptional regulator [Lachnospirales]MDA3734260.1 Crp/Fnr family transcriptional regulator [Holtiella tumoricola]